MIITHLQIDLSCEREESMSVSGDQFLDSSLFQYRELVFKVFHWFGAGHRIRNHRPDSIVHKHGDHPNLLDFEEHSVMWAHRCVAPEIEADYWSGRD